MVVRSHSVDLPLFPLSSVLYPRGRLSLRIFEPRYLDLVRECARSDAGFGVCHILHGGEVGPPAVPAAVGTVARITDFHAGADGLLNIVVEGGERFTVTRSRARHDGQLRGDVALWPAEPVREVPVEFALLQSIAERLVETMAAHWRNAARSHYEDATWLGFRLAELLPLDAGEQQHMLEVDDPLQRLAELRDILP
ncbi:MAG: LON peptidase substrate-binding domain-containing protein, partial [Rhodanobacter sp.]